MLKRIISFLVCMTLFAGLISCACALDAAEERVPCGFYRTDHAACFFFWRIAEGENLTPVLAQTTRFADVGALPSLVSEGRTPVTYVLLMDSTHYMKYRREEVKALVDGLLQNNFARTHLVLVPFDADNGIRWDEIVDSDAYADIEAGCAAIHDKIDTITYCFQGETVPATKGILDALNWIRERYPSETGGIVHVIAASYLLESMNARPEELESIKNIVSTMPQIFFHTVQLGDRQTQIPEFGRGLQLTTKDDFSPDAAAYAINAYAGNMERILIPYESSEDASEDILLFLKPLLRDADGSEYLPSGFTIPSIPRVNTTDVDVIINYDAAIGDISF